MMTWQETLTKSFSGQRNKWSFLAVQLSFSIKSASPWKSKKSNLACSVIFVFFKTFHYLEHKCAPPPLLHHCSTPVYPQQSDLHSNGPQSHHGGSHYSRAGRLSRSKEPLHSSCHPAPLRPVPTSGLDSSIHLQRQGQMKETLNMRKGTLQAETWKSGRKMGIQLKLTRFYRNIVFSTALVVREKWEQFSTAAYWIRGITPAQIRTLATMMSRPPCVYSPITTNLKERHQVFNNAFPMSVFSVIEKKAAIINVNFVIISMNNAQNWPH